MNWPKPYDGMAVLRLNGVEFGPVRLSVRVDGDRLVAAVVPPRMIDSRGMQGQPVTATVPDGRILSGLIASCETDTRGRVTTEYVWNSFDLPA